MRVTLTASAAALFVLALLAEVAEGASGLQRAEELFKRKQYERAKVELGADTTSLTGTSLDEALLMLAALETNAARAETLYRRVMTSGDARASQKARLELAKIRYASGDYRTTLEVLSGGRVQEGDQDRDEIAYLTGLCREQLGDAAGARADFSAIGRGDYHSWADLARADLDIQEGKIAEAIARYEDIDRSRASPIARFKLGECYEILGQKDKALGIYRDLVERFPRSIEAGKGKEKIQLLGQPKTKTDQGTAAGGSVAGERGRGGEKGTAAAGRGYTLQFGSFASRENAVSVAAKLEKLLPAVRVESVEMEGRVWQRVRAGIYDTRDAAEKDLVRAKDRSGLAGAIIPLK